MGFKVIKMLRNLDDFGHPVNVSFKGEESYKSPLGGILTIAVRLLTLVIVYKAVAEVFNMEDPVIKSIARPIGPETRN